MNISLYENIKNKGKTMTFEQSYRTWHRLLFNKCMRIFTWEGLPFEQKEVEFLLLSQGFCGITTHNNGTVYSGSMFGVTKYYDEFKSFIFDNPVTGSKVLTIGKDVVIVNNDDLRTSILPLINRYSTLLAHLDLTLQSYAVNVRATDIFETSDSQTAESVKEWYNSLLDGKLCAIISKNDLTNMIGVEALKNVANARPNTNSLNDIITAEFNVLKNFYNDIGVKSSTDKRERLITEEVQSEDGMLLFNIDGMLANRQKAVEDINSIFDWNVSVKLNPIFEEGGNNNDVYDGVTKDNTRE